MKNNNYQISIKILCLNYIMKYDCKEKTINYSSKWEVNTLVQSKQFRI